MSPYAAAVRLYPRAFRREYGEDLLALADEMRLDMGRPRAAVRLTCDVLVSLPARHLEVIVKRPAPVLLPALAGLAALTMLVMAAVLGTAAGIGLLLLALPTAAVAALVLPHARVVRERSLTSRWWQLIALGLALHLALIVAQQLTDSDDGGVWLLAVAAVVGGWTCIGAGLVLAVVHLVTRRRPATT
jgi:drug/metabolite transporter (DMT)-like permease